MDSLSVDIFAVESFDSVASKQLKARSLWLRVAGSRELLMTSNARADRHLQE